jgi:hypothetical protein
MFKEIQSLNDASEIVIGARRQSVANDYIWQKLNRIAAYIDLRVSIVAMFLDIQD